MTQPVKILKMNNVSYLRHTINIYEHRNNLAEPCLSDIGTIAFFHVRIYCFSHGSSN